VNGARWGRARCSRVDPQLGVVRRERLRAIALAFGTRSAPASVTEEVDVVRRVVCERIAASSSRIVSRCEQRTGSEPRHRRSTRRSRAHCPAPPPSAPE
jgi:hypothetical protein